MRKIVEYFDVRSSVRQVIIYFILTLIAALLMNLLMLPMIVGQSGIEKIPDMMMGGYSLQDVMNILNGIGPEGRRVFLYYQLPLDMIYPYLYGSFMALFIARLLKLSGLWSRASLLVLLPVVAAIADYLENIFDIVFLLRYPHLSAGMVSLASFFTITKGLALILSFLSIVILIVIYLFKKKPVT